MSRAPWIFAAAVPVSSLHRCDDSGLLARGVCWVAVTARIVVACDRDDEGGEVAVADDLPKLPFGFEHAGGGPAQRHFTRGPALDVALGAADGLHHRPARVRALERALQVAVDAEP